MGSRYVSWRRCLWTVLIFLQSLNIVLPRFPFQLTDAMFVCLFFSKKFPWLLRLLLLYLLSPVVYLFLFSFFEWELLDWIHFSVCGMAFFMILTCFSIFIQELLPWQNRGACNNELGVSPRGGESLFPPREIEWDSEWGKPAMKWIILIYAPFICIIPKPGWEVAVFFPFSILSRLVQSGLSPSARL